MKFLCVLCDQPMKLVEVAPPDRGALSVVYECPECAHRIAMLTNPLETQMVQSLGVQIGPGGEKGEAKCPFSGTVQAMESAPAADALAWTAEALERLTKVPEFVRPMARAGIERYARERGLEKVDAQVLDQAKSFFGM
jgi:Proto-chlorophyllide reductase 57 kD subunit